MLIRYLSKEKFEWLLGDKGIYIGSASSQNDNNEGIYNSGLISKVLRVNVHNKNEMFWHELDSLSYNLMITKRDVSYLSSWYFGDVECRVMWDEYGNDGVALISDETLLIQRLPEPLGNASSFYKVEYNNDKKGSAVNESLRFKEERYLHESEFRLVVDMNRYSILTGFDTGRFGIVYEGSTPSYESAEMTCCMSPEGIAQSHRVIVKKGDGYVIKFDLQMIIREIRLHPDCTEEDVSHISKRLESHGIKVTVRRSDLSAHAVGAES